MRKERKREFEIATKGVLWMKGAGRRAEKRRRTEKGETNKRRRKGETENARESEGYGGSERRIKKVSGGIREREREEKDRTTRKKGVR